MHGRDIAGKNRADPSSMIAAMELLYGSPGQMRE